MIPGAVAFSESEGFWIISSVPRFPATVSTGFEYGESQTKKGQIILCVTVPGNIEDTISKFISYQFQMFGFFNIILAIPSVGTSV